MRSARLRQVLLLDAAFEIVLALVLIIAPLTPLEDNLALPPPVDASWVYFTAAIVLMAVTVLILYWATTLRDLEVGILALGNGVGGLILAAWVFLRDDFTTSGVTFILGVAAVLIVLAAIQAALLFRRS